MKRWLRRSLSKTTSGSVRSGFLAVYVGLDQRRFVVPTRFMNYPIFAMLLEKAEEEIGSQPAGGLVLTCEVAFFQCVLDALQRDEERFRTFGIEEFTRYFNGDGSETNFVSGCNFKNDDKREDYCPLIPKARV